MLFISMNDRSRTLLNLELTGAISLHDSGLRVFQGDRQLLLTYNSKASRDKDRARLGSDNGTYGKYMVMEE